MCKIQMSKTNFKHAGQNCGTTVLKNNAALLKTKTKYYAENKINDVKPFIEKNSIIY